MARRRRGDWKAEIKRDLIRLALGIAFAALSGLVVYFGLTRMAPAAVEGALEKSRADLKAKP